MRDTYSQDEAARALGNITRRTLYNWLRAEGLIEPGKQVKILTRSEVDLLASRHHRDIIDIDTQRDPLQEISQLQEQIARLEARMLRFEAQLQTITSLLGNRLSLEDEADERKNDPSC